MKNIKTLFLLMAICLLAVVFGFAIFNYSPAAQKALAKVASEREVGDAVDSLNGVKVYYNGAVSHTGERHVSADGYNYGLRWQCVEFVKRYYHDYLDHKMPDTYGHAKDFFDAGLADGKLSKKRNLIQYTNGSKTRPQVNDLLVFDATAFNKYGHVAIISKVNDDKIELVQQNPGPTASSRATYALEEKNGKWTIDRDDLLGWLRKE